MLPEMTSAAVAAGMGVGAAAGGPMSPSMSVAVAVVSIVVIVYIVRLFLRRSAESSGVSPADPFFTPPNDSSSATVGGLTTDLFGSDPTRARRTIDSRAAETTSCEEELVDPVTSVVEDEIYGSRPS